MLLYSIFIIMKKEVDIMIIPFKNNTPDVSEAAFVAESAAIIGSVVMHEG